MNMCTLHKGDTIGLAAPSWLMTPEKAQPIIDALTGMGYRVKCPDKLFANSWGYAASPEERADAFNQMIRDDEVKMVFFSGGEGADDVTPLLDYEAARNNPKIYLSYSDGTSILNTLWAKGCGRELYGQMPGLVTQISDYDLGQFERFTTGLPEKHTPNTQWHCLTPGRGEGTLIGGYLLNFTYLVLQGVIPLDRDYVLFIEDHEQFFKIEAESAFIGRFEQCGIMPHVKGLLFGHYSTPVNEQLLERLRRLGERWNIPVAYCDDFGHGENHAIFPIGEHAVLDTDAGTLEY